MFPHWPFYLLFLFVVQSHQPVAALALLRKLYHLDVSKKSNKNSPPSSTKTKVIQERTENILLVNFVGDSNCFFLWMNEA